jgi:hypothetical protein
MLSHERVIRYDGLDQVTQEWISTDEDLYSPGEAMPSYTNVKIREVQCSSEKGDYRYRLAGVGLAETKGTRQEDGYPKITLNLDGFDEATDSYITTNEGLIERGDALDGFSNMYCVSVSIEQIHEDFFKVQGRYIGLIGSKPYKRRITVNGNTINPANPVKVSLDGGWSTPAKAQLQIPNIVLVDSYVQVGGPPTDAIPGNATPPDAPDVKDLSWTGEVTKIWPHGWVLSSIDGEFIAGTEIWAGSYTYSYVFPSQLA